MPASGYHFLGWSGDLTGNENPTDIRATLNKTITAHFIPQQFASNDELLTIAIPEGTMVMDEEDELLSSLELVVDETPLMPPPMSGIVGLPYNLGPSGTTFNQLITITLSYDPADIPLRTGEEDLILAYYDEDAGEWVELSSVVDTANSTVTALVDHFTTFAIIAPILHAKINWVILGPIIAVFVFLVVFLRIRIPTKKTI